MITTMKHSRVVLVGLLVSGIFAMDKIILKTDEEVEEMFKLTVKISELTGVKYGRVPLLMECYWKYVEDPLGPAYRMFYHDSPWGWNASALVNENQISKEELQRYKDISQKWQQRRDAKREAAAKRRKAAAEEKQRLNKQKMLNELKSLNKVRNCSSTDAEETNSYCNPLLMTTAKETMSQSVATGANETNSMQLPEPVKKVATQPMTLQGPVATGANETLSLPEPAKKVATQYLCDEGQKAQYLNGRQTEHHQQVISNPKKNQKQSKDVKPLPETMSSNVNHNRNQARPKPRQSGSVSKQRLSEPAKGTQNVCTYCNKRKCRDFYDIFHKKYGARCCGACAKSGGQQHSKRCNKAN